MKKLLTAAIIPAGLGMAAFSGFPAETQMPQLGIDSTLVADEGIDVLKQALAMNADNLPKPPSHFKAGHISFADISPDYLTKTKNGFIIKLPSNTNVPTPAIYDGKLYERWLWQQAILRL